MAVHKVNNGFMKKKVKFLSLPDPSPFLPTSVPYPHTEFTQALFQVTWSFPDRPITQHSSGHTEATALRPLQVLILDEWTRSLRPHSATYISITQRQLLAPSIVPYEYKRKPPKTYRQERQKKSTQRAQPRKLAKLGVWEWQNFITAETISVSHTVTWVKWDSLS